MDNDSNMVLRVERLIANEHGCRAVYVDSVPVYDEVNGKREWYGFVAVFNLFGHEKCRRAYAWCPPGFSSAESCRVELEMPPVISPVSAVRRLLAQFDPAFAARATIAQRLPRMIHDTPSA